MLLKFLEEADIFLVAAGGLNVAAALLHLACIFAGAPLYRFLGAGEHMARRAERGDWYPTVVVLFLSTLLLIFAYYCLAGATQGATISVEEGAGMLVRPPFLKLGLLGITLLFFARASVACVAFYKAQQGKDTLYLNGTGGTIKFWYVTSGICLIFALTHAVGLWRIWAQL